MFHRFTVRKGSSFYNRPPLPVRMRTDPESRQPTVSLHSVAPSPSGRIPVEILRPALSKTATRLVSSARQRPRNNSLFPQTDSKFRLRYPEHPVPAVCCKYHSHLRTTDRPPDPSSRHALRPAAPPQSGAYSILRRDKPANPVEQDSGRSTPFHGPNAVHPP